MPRNDSGFIRRQCEPASLTVLGRRVAVLRARLLDKMLSEQESARAAERRAMVGSGDRSAKIRTYNFPQSRVTDHRINLSVHNLADVINGDLEPLVTALRRADREELSCA